MTPEQIIHILFGIFFLIVGIIIIKENKFRFIFFGKETLIKKSDKPVFFWVFFLVTLSVGITFLKSGIT